MTIQQDYFGHDHVTVIKPGRKLASLNLKELWAYRELIWVMAMRDIKVRYKQTTLGVLWAVLQPFLMMVIFTIVFSRTGMVASGNVPYPVFVYAALVPWLFFANAVGSCGNSLVGSAHLIGKIYFPRLIIPLSSIGALVLDFAAATAVMIGIMIYYGVPLSSSWLALPLLLIALSFCALGVGTLLAALTVTYRDFRYVIPFMLQIWMFATPVIYPARSIPEKWLWLIQLNPLTGLIEGFRAAYLGQTFDMAALGSSIGISLVLLLAGVAYFERVERRFADII